jgi:hypothetical protein
VSPGLNFPPKLLIKGKLIIAMMQKMRRFFALVAVIILLFLSTAGCIDIYLLDEYLVPREEKPLEYIWQNYHFDYNFTSTFTEAVELYSETFEVEIKPQSQQMRFDLSVHMRSAEEVWEIINDSLDVPDWLEELVQRMLEFTDQRYIEITITLPDGFELYNRRFNQTTDVKLDLISSPTEGIWLIEVEGAGSGFDEFQGVEYKDSFSIDVIVKELKE